MAFHPLGLRPENWSQRTGHLYEVQPMSPVSGFTSEILSLAIANHKGGCAHLKRHVGGLDEGHRGENLAGDSRGEEGRPEGERLAVLNFLQRNVTTWSCMKLCPSHGVSSSLRHTSMRKNLMRQVMMRTVERCAFEPQKAVRSTKSAT